jgi:hypothetical protein
MNRFRIIVIISLLSLSSQYVHAQLNVELGKARKEQSICLHAGLMRNFRALSSQHILFQYDSKTFYLMTMKRSCFGLRDTFRMYPGGSGQACSNRNDEIMYEDKAGGRESCAVDTIDYVESRDAAKALIKERKEARKKQKDEE